MKERRNTMDDEAIKVLAGSVAAALVKAMTGGLWQQLRRRMATVLGRGDQRRERRVRDQLDDSRTRMEAAPEAVREEVGREVMAEWRGTLRTLLTEHPGAAQELRAMLVEMEARLPGTPGEVSVAQMASATGGSVVYQAGRDLTGGHAQRGRHR
jgi:hypothetical protein